MATRAVAGARSGEYQGERLNFESAAAFFGQLTELRWNMVREMLGAGRVGVRELARRLGRDVKRVHQDAHALVALGLLEQDEGGGLICPFADIHIDMHLTQDRRKAA
ncbi:HVO_A0114 family putative DNA-binding protein [Achromobacter ruhlandii]|uniref:HVO_A0114 family putative DNA-binding protein n=1 Tax=Achromobacter ruhlandii TaxID=72557 RepID=UPI003F8C141B